MTVHPAGTWCSVALVLLVAGCETDRAPPSEAELEDLARRVDDLTRRNLYAPALAAIEELLGPVPAAPTEGLGATSARLRREQAKLLVALSRSREAIAVLRFLEVVRPGDAELRHQLALAHLALGDGRAAVRVLEGGPGSALRTTRLDYGRALTRTGQTREGAAALAAHLIEDPWDDTGYLLLGRAIARLGRKESAEVFLSRYRDAEARRYDADQDALRHEGQGKFAMAAWVRGEAERKRGRLHRALELYNEAIRRDRNMGLSYIGVSQVQLLLEQPELARDRLRTLPRQPPVLLALGDALVKTGEWKEARACFEAARAEAPEAGDRLDDLDHLEMLQAADAYPDDLERLRIEVRRSMVGRGVKQSTAQLLGLVDALGHHARSQVSFRVPAEVRWQARCIVLFFYESDPGDSRVARATLRICSEPDELFWRLGARRALGSDEDAAFDAELARVGLDATLVRRALAGERLSNPG